MSGLGEVTSISAGSYHTCAVKADGTVACWGWNHYGQLGDGTTNDGLVPAPVPGLSSVVQVSAGSLHTCALLTDGTLSCLQLRDALSLWAAETPESLLGNEKSVFETTARALEEAARVDDAVSSVAPLLGRLNPAG